MIYEGVNFSERAVRRMSREDFVAMHEAVLWRDRKIADRRKMLRNAYKLMCSDKEEEEE